MAKTVIVLDAETTGLDAKTDEILQLTILSGNGKTLFNEYILPINHDSWPEAEKIHHISYSMVKDCKPISAYKKTISEIINQADVIVGYNHSFDMAFLEAAEIPSNPTKNYDLMLEFSQLMGEWDAKHNHYKWFKLKECADYFGYNWGNDFTHNSMADCKAILFCYNKILSGETNKGGKKNSEQHPSAFRSTGHSSKKGVRFLTFVLPVAALLIIGFALFSMRNMYSFPKRTLKTVTKSTLQKVLDISDLSTVEFRFGSVTQALDKKQKVKYYVTYNGTVQIGVDFQEIAKSIVINNTDNTISVTIPQPKVLSTNVNVETLDYIFKIEKYNTQGVTDEALKVCKQDLTDEVNRNTKIMDIAKENAQNAITQLLDPWLKQSGVEYTIIFK